MTYADKEKEFYEKYSFRWGNTSEPIKLTPANTDGPITIEAGGVITIGFDFEDDLVTDILEVFEREKD